MQTFRPILCDNSQRAELQAHAFVGGNGIGLDDNRHTRSWWHIKSRANAQRRLISADENLAHI
jgi:hypothetical protein